MYSKTRRGSREDRSRQGPSHDTWPEREKTHTHTKKTHRKQLFVVLSAEQDPEHGDEVCLHPCRIHQRVFEQTDSRRTPLSAINQQQRLSSLSVLS